MSFYWAPIISIIQERSILMEDSQKGLEQITDQMKKRYMPDQIFVESDFNQTAKLDWQYQLYLKNKYAKFTDFKFFFCDSANYKLQGESLL
ncbi:hypothetical protein [Pedobacter chitinilyticus]|uniref:Uncharacterized protein n=2 Tax=Pedobacter chitinilyticus TaxID=2233776 RepID=A0A443Z2T1_9SPHI|nr:hypothetical protein [Pedobacter chitinilyticus]RWU10821.1 hypothetical protein DPV69_05685 [Pedobacter chitinilyticus]